MGCTASKGAGELDIDAFLFIPNGFGQHHRPQVLEQAELLQGQHHAAARLNERERCNSLIEQLTATLVNRMPDDQFLPGGDRLKSFAESQARRGNSLSAVFFARVAANLYGIGNASRRIAECAAVIEKAAVGMIEHDRFDYRQLGTSYFIPAIDSLREKIARLDDDSARRVGDDENGRRSVWEASCSSSVVAILLHLEEYERAEEVAGVGLQHFESTYPVSICLEFDAYGSLLHNLAQSLHVREQYSAAIKLYSQALTARKFGDEPLSDFKRKAVEETEKMLKMAIDGRR